MLDHIVLLSYIVTDNNDGYCDDDCDDVLTLCNVMGFHSSLYDVTMP